MSSVPRVRVTVPVDDTVMTKQASADYQSIESQLKRYVNMGLVPSMGHAPRYGDFTGIGDFHDCLQRVREAEQQFAGLPAHVRKLADNDPGKFLEMVYGGKPEVVDELVKAGLLEVQLPVEVQKVQLVDAEGQAVTVAASKKRSRKEDSVASSGGDETA